MEQPRQSRSVRLSFSVLCLGFTGHIPSPRWDRQGPFRLSGQLLSGLSREGSPERGPHCGVARPAQALGSGISAPVTGGVAPSVAWGPELPRPD